MTHKTDAEQIAEMDALDRRNRGRELAEAEARMGAGVPRRELLAAIDEVIKSLAGSGWSERDIVADAFRQLAELLK